MALADALIGLFVGIIIGAVAMRFGNRKLREQQTLQQELKKSKDELKEFSEKLINHFARSATLLDNMAYDYRQLYYHMAKSYNNLLPDQRREDNPFSSLLTEAETDNYQTSVEIQPRDYPKNASGLLSTTRGVRSK
ncbi:Z-ring associated protein ZapG [Sodalis endosymbiont of Henestaris halophilus]|uniref:Z-ring associated protein ZapG n=1 Tax=Sodalis endosymbiont of Henestaris halophilus TaxID=1929246 RepID=UPI000BC0ADEB|nr:Z-ring associated protein ZapG [Sodalis endosymbiont of Henestaris halophilus]SNC59047.1 Inner membrane protein YhcB [Sodalis endosymbiont of Henestaris halophilus]